MEIVIEQTKNNFSAYSPEYPGCIATGGTKDGVIKNFKEALELHLKGLQEDTE